MADEIVPAPAFTGLDLLSPPDKSGCIDLLNVDLEQPGVIKSRRGYTTFSTATSGLQGPASPFYTTSGDRQLVVWDNTVDLRALDDSGASIATHTTPATLGNSFARFGTPTAERLYIANGDDMTRWDGTSFTTLTTPDARPWYVTVQPGDNRLVAAAQGSTSGSFTASPSRVYFSDAGDPETFDSTNFVDLTPGDGEFIRGAATWRNLVMIFKQTKFFVFYGNGVDSTGGSLFNYRTVDVGTPLHGSQGAFNSAFQFGTAVTNHGLYFATMGGLYRTTGGEPVRVSAPVEPLFSNTNYPFFQGSAFSFPTSMVAVRDTIYLLCEGTTSSILTYNTRSGAWGYLQLAHEPTALTSFKDDDDVEELVTIDAVSGGDIRRFSAAATTDAGTSISAHYQTGFFDWGVPGRTKVLEDTDLWGSGTVTLAAAGDYGSLNTGGAGGGSVASEVTVTLGTAPAVERQHVNLGASARVISHRISGTAPWAVHAVHHNITWVEPPGIG